MPVSFVEFLNMVFVRKSGCD